MVITRILISVAIVLLFVTCTSKEDREYSKQKEQERIQQLKDAKTEKIDEVSKLKNEIEELRKKRDSLKSVWEMSQTENELTKIIKSTALDHVVIAVKNLHQTESNFSNLGFIIEKGSLHKNGIINSFIKFESGRYIELLTVKNPADELANKYGEFFTKREEGVYFALNTTDINQIQSVYSNNGYVINKSENANLTTASFNDGELDKFFFIEYKKESNDSNELVSHLNLAYDIVGVWIGCENLVIILEKYFGAGFINTGEIVHPILNKEGQKLSTGRGEIYLIESEERIFGITLLTNDIEETKTYLDNKLNIKLKLYNDMRGRSIFLSPDYGTKIWLEFLEIFKN